MSVPAQSLTLADHALAYAARGYEVFPASPADKAPLTEHGMKDATTDAATIAAWWAEHPDALIACRIPANVVVLDIDPRHGGDRTWQALLDHYGDHEAQRWHASGRGDDGRHRWYFRPAGKLSAKPLHEFARANGTGHAAGKRSWTSGIDVLHHDWRYTILPPSPHPATGRPYTWGAQDEPGPMPPWLAHYITAPVAAPTQPLPVAPRTGLRIADADSIADWYSANHRWGDILDGWVLVAGDGDTDGSLWRHPNATAAHSASIRHGCLFVYTPNTDLDETEEGNPRGYTRFRAWAELHHDGDLSAAARAARELRDGPPIVRPASPLGAPVAPSAVPAGQPPVADEVAPEVEPEVEPDSDWGRRDLVTVAREMRAGVRQKQLPEVVAVEGAVPLFYRGRVNQVFGASGDGKSWVALHACVEAVQRGQMVMYVDWEDNEDGITARFLSLGLEPDDLELVDYRNPSSGLGSTMAFEGLAGCTEQPYAVIVVDSTGEAMAAGGVDGNVDGEVAAWFRHAKTMARWPSLPAVLLIDHVPKAEDAPRGAIGSQRKTAAITGAAYEARQVVAFAIGKPGKIKLTVHKDRLGHRPKGTTACEVHVEPTGDDGVAIACRVSEAAEAAAKGETFRPTVLMERVSRWLEDHPGDWSQREVESNVAGKAAGIRAAIKALVGDGFVVEVPTAKGVRLATKAPYREPSADVLPAPRPRVPTASPPRPGTRPSTPDATASPASPCINTRGPRDAVAGAGEAPIEGATASRVPVGSAVQPELSTLSQGEGEAAPADLTPEEPW